MPRQFASHTVKPGDTCFYCGVEFELGHPRKQPSFDHTTPKSKGGKESTVVLACFTCNAQKRDRDIEQYRGLLFLKQPVAKAGVELMAIASLYQLPELNGISEALLMAANRVVFNGEA